MKSKDKISYKDLNGWLKLLVVYGFANLGLIALGVILGLLGY